MSDTSLKKLFVEMRAAKDTEALLDTRREKLKLLDETITERKNKAQRRKRVLDETLRLHIHEGMTVLVAKMAAAEAIDAQEAKAKAASSSQWGIHGSTIIAGSITSNRLVVGFADGKRTQWQRVLAWLYIKLGGAK